MRILTVKFRFTRLWSNVAQTGKSDLTQSIEKNSNDSTRTAARAGDISVFCPSTVPEYIYI